MTTSKQTTTESKGANQLESTHHLASLTLLGLVLGLTAGIVFGEYCGPLKIVGDIFVGLLRMTVLPYIIVSLIANIGRLTLKQSRRLAVIGGATILLLWAVSLLAVVCFAHAYPEWKGGSFYSTTALAEPRSVDIVELFVPSNVFDSLSKNHIPAVVVLCICVGVALSARRDRGHVIQTLDVLAKVFVQISSAVAKLTPFGVFAIAANTAGTLPIDQVDRLQAHLIIYSSAALFLGLFVLPLLVAMLTPFRYSDVLRVTRSAVLTAFATGKLIIVLPMLIDETERLLRAYGLDQETESEAAVDVLYPVAYPFPHMGKLLGIIFIPFVAWFLGDAMTLSEYPTLLSAGLFSYFGGPTLAMPFLLDMMKLPHDMFQLFLILGVYEGRVGDALGVLHLAAFSLISASAFAGRLEFRAAKLGKLLLTFVLVGGVIVAGLYGLLGRVLDMSENRENIIAAMQLLDHPTAASLIRQGERNPVPLEKGESVLDRIRRRGIIRIGYNEDKLPFSYFNQDGVLVGFDADMAHALAKDLGVTIEFVRFDRNTLIEQLEDDHFDVVMSGLVGTLERAEAMAHTEAYLDVTLGLVVRDYRAAQFRTVEQLRRIGGLKIGFVDLSRGFVGRLQQSLPTVDLVELATNQSFFDEAHSKLDALLISAESGSAFTLLYPEFEVVVPPELKTSLPLFYAIGNRDAVMREFLQHWISLRRKDRTVQKYYDHWVLGKSQSNNGPRWSVIRNVLKLVD